MANCNSEIVLKHYVWIKYKYIPVLNELLITDSLRLHNICILKKTSSCGMTIILDCTEM